MFGASIQIEASVSPLEFDTWHLEGASVRARLAAGARAPQFACAVYMRLRTHRGWPLGPAERGARLQRKGASARECVWLRARASICLCCVHVASYPRRLAAGTRGKGGPLAEDDGR
jgi:hypothetical protein